MKLTDQLVFIALGLPEKVLVNKQIIVHKQIIADVRLSKRRVLQKDCVVKGFAKFTGKHVHQSLFFSKAAVCMHKNLIKRDYSTGVF